MRFFLPFADASNGRASYPARVRHWTVAVREAREKMGSHQGWAVATNQLATLARKI